MLKEAQVQEIETRLKAATPGPWQTRFILRMFKSAREDSTLHIETDQAQDWPDSDLIAHAPEDLAALLAEVTLARRVVEAAERLTQGTQMVDPHGVKVVFEDLRRMVDALTAYTAQQPKETR